MKYAFILAAFTLFIPVATAQLQVDDGIRNPQAMMVSGDSVIDDDEDETDEEDDFDDVNQDINVPDNLSEEDREMLEDGLEDSRIPAPILPESPSYPQEPKKNVKRVVKPVQQMKIRRSIADDRIDDNYVQEMVKDNQLFTPGYKTQ